MEFCGWEIGGGGGGGQTRDRKDWNFLQVQLEDYGERWQPTMGWEKGKEWRDLLFGWHV